MIIYISTKKLGKGFITQTFLKEDGLLLFSVPDMIENEVHKVLFDEQKIKDLIGRYLKLEEFYIQDKVGISNKPAKFPAKCYIGVARKC